MVVGLFERMVAPSLVMVTSPTSSTIILSRPTGPRLLLTMFAMDEAAITFCVLTSCNEKVTALRDTKLTVKDLPSRSVTSQSERWLDCTTHGCSENQKRGQFSASNGLI